MAFTPIALALGNRSSRRKPQTMEGLAVSTYSNNFRYFLVF